MTNSKTSVAIIPMNKLYSRDTVKEANITIDLLVEVQKISAEIVKLYGDIYLPIFIRIHQEIENKKRNQSYKEIALQVLENNS